MFKRGAKGSVSTEEERVAALFCAQWGSERQFSLHNADDGGCLLLFNFDANF